MNSTVKRAAGVITAALLFAAAPGVSVADAPGEGGDEQSRPKPGNAHGGSDTDDQTINVTVHGIVYDRSKNGRGTSTGAVTPEVNTAPPPKCWFVPSMTPEEFKKLWEPRLELVKDTPWGKQKIDEWVNGKPIKDFNTENAGKGNWWVPEINDDPKAQGDIDKCFDDSSFWADKGEKPKVEEAIDAEKLSRLAYAELRVPDTDITLNPSSDGRQTVNLPTWAWLDKSTFKEVSVTASVPEIGLSATTTAKPVALRIEPGTSEAELHPASGECAIGEDGSIGTPYAKGRSKETPPCGVTYLRANTGSGPYAFKATITWEVSWTATDGSGGDLPDGTFGTTTEVTVQEAQAVNR
ncbi:hypothetical protein [Streptomyces sp. NPDC018031]|uniref:hypothetical protein n=1 Tax=Streptomyces sp. NPDC018031 TaxID=3365033 RepID=UPI0037A75DAF